MRKLFTKREKIIFYIAIMVVVFTASFNLFNKIFFNKNESLNKDIQITRAKFKKYLRLLKQRENIQAQAGQFPSMAAEAGTQDEVSVSILSELESLAQSADVKILDIRPEAGYQSTGAYKETIVDLRTEGTMENYLKFIYNLENSLSLLRIRNFQLSAKSGSQLLEGSFSISQFSLAG